MGVEAKDLVAQLGSNPLMTLMTMISTATPSVTPSTEIKVMTETNVLLGRRYRSASSSSNGNRDMRAKLDAAAALCQRIARSAMRPSPLTPPRASPHSRTAVSSLSFNRFRVVSLPRHALVVLAWSPLRLLFRRASPPRRRRSRQGRRNEYPGHAAWLPATPGTASRHSARHRAQPTKPRPPRRRMPKPRRPATRYRQALASQRAQELEAIQSSNRMILFVAGLFAALGFLAMLFMAYFQWRTSTGWWTPAALPVALRSLRLRRLQCWLRAMRSEVSVGPPEQSNRRLLAALERLEKRINQLEHTPIRRPLKALPSPSRPTGPRLPPMESTRPRHPADAAAAPDDVRFAMLLGKGQSLLSLEQPKEALACFDQALALDPNHPEALVKKGAALERLRMLDEAIACYDQAIAADRSITWLSLQGRPVKSHGTFRRGAEVLRASVAHAGNRRG